MSREVMQLALDALEKSNAAYRGYGEYLSKIDVDATAEAIAALKAELDTSEPEPVAWASNTHNFAGKYATFVVACHKSTGWDVPLYLRGDL